MALFSITGETLHDALANVLPHADSGANTLPVLACVQVTVADDGLVTFVATDRYTIGVAEVASDETTELEPGEFLLLSDVAKNIVKLAKAAKRGPVAITANVGSYSVDVRDLFGQTSVSARLETGEFPQWRKLWPTDDVKADVARIGLGAKHLAKFAKLYNHGSAIKLPTLDCTFYTAVKPLVVNVVELTESDASFRALVMPVRLAGVK